MRVPETQHKTNYSIRSDPLRVKSLKFMCQSLSLAEYFFVKQDGIATNVLQKTCTGFRIFTEMTRTKEQERQLSWEDNLSLAFRSQQPDCAQMKAMPCFRHLHPGLTAWGFGSKWDQNEFLSGRIRPQPEASRTDFEILTVISRMASYICSASLLHMKPWIALLTLRSCTCHELNHFRSLP